MQTITAMFDKRSDAIDAQQQLLALGLTASQVKLLPDTEVTPSTTAGSYNTPQDEGFWASLKDFFMPEEDRHSYAEGIRRGGTMVSVTTDDVHSVKAMDILEQRGSIDLDERESSWRKEGWGGYQAASTTNSAVAAAPSVALSGGSAASGSLSSSAAATDKDYIPVVEENLRVGKRATESGRVRLRSYVVETPVNEQVSLHSESVHVDRRPVDRPVTAADEALFADKTIEAVAHSEEAVVSKDVRVKEEIGIQKHASDRVETVSDTVRHTEVEVEDAKGVVTKPVTTETLIRK